MKRGEELALEGMKAQWKKLVKIAEKAKQEADEYIHVGTEMINIHNEFVDIVKSNDHSKEALAKLGALKKRSEKAEAIRKKDLLKLLDKQSEAEINASALATEISIMEFRLKRYRQ